MKNIIIFFLALFCVAPSNAQDSLNRQSVYKYRLGVDIPIGLLTLGTGTTSFILRKKKSPLTFEELSNLQVSDINKFDRYAIYQHSKAASIASDVFQYTSMISPALLFIDKNIRKDWKTVMPIWMETFALTSALTMFAKEMAKRKRPYVYSTYDNGNKYSKDALSSMWSGHTSITAASTYFIAMVYADYHPDSRFKPLMWTGAALIPALTGLTRVKAGKHYWTDVIVGYAVGAFIGTMTPYLHRRNFKRN